jgi:hypothetical protein
MLTLSELLDRGLSGKNAAKAVIEELWRENESLRAELVARKEEKIEAAATANTTDEPADDFAAESEGDDTAALEAEVRAMVLKRLEELRR